MLFDVDKGSSCKLNMLKRCPTVAADWPIFILILVSVIEMPLDAAVHIGLSDTPYTILDSSVAAQLSDCTTLPGPLTNNMSFMGQCQSEVSGRYVYVYREGSTRMDLTEIQIYSTKRMWHIFVFGKHSHSKFHPTFTFKVRLNCDRKIKALWLLTICDSQLISV